MGFVVERKNPLNILNERALKLPTHYPNYK